MNNELLKTKLLITATYNLIEKKAIEVHTLERTPMPKIKNFNELKELEEEINTLNNEIALLSEARYEYIERETLLMKEGK